MQSLTPPVDMPENRRGSSSQSESPSVKSKKAFGRILPRNTNDPEPPPVVTEKRLVLVMGATGLVGGSVARGLLSYPWYCVLVATRRPWCAEAVLLKQAGAKLVEVDFNYKHSLVLAMQGVSCVFLHTSFWENYSCTMEVIHGQNAVDAAVEAEVEHLIYNGTNYVKPEDGRVCSFLKSKLEIEDYIRDSGLMYTIVVLPFYFENFLSVFRPFEITPDLFVMTLPLENSLISCACLHDMALCICKIIQQGTLYMEHKVTLSAEMLSVQQMITHFSKSLDGLSFIDPELTVEDFQDFGFPGSKDMAAMFLFYQMCEDIPDFSVTRALNPHTRSMQQWIEDNHAHIVEVLEEALCTVKSCHVKFHKPPHLRHPSDDHRKERMEQSSENALGDLQEEDETADSQSSLKTSCSQSTNFSNNSDVPNPKQEDRVSSTELPFRGSKWALARTAWSRRLWTGGTRRKSSAQWMMEDFKALQRRIQQSKGAVHPEAGSSSPATPTASGPDHGPGETAAAEACITPCLAGGDEEREGPPPPPPPVTPQHVAEQQRPLTELSGKGGEEVSRQVQRQSRGGFVVDVLPTVSEASPPTENQPSVADDVPTPGPPPLPTAHRPQRRHQRRSDNDGRAQFPTPLFVRDHPPYYNNNNNVCARDRGDQDFAGPYGHVQHGGLLARGWECWELGPDSRTPTPDVGAGFQQFLHHPESLPSYMDYSGYHHGTGSDSDCDADYRRGYFRQEGGYLIPPRSPTDSLPTTAPTSTLVQPFWGRGGGGAQQGMMEAMGLPFPSASPTDQSDSDTCGLKVGRGFGWSLDGGGSDTPLSEDDKPGGRPPHSLRRPHDSRGLQDAWLIQHHMVDRSLDSDQTTSLFSSSSPSSPSPSSSSTLTPSTSSEVRGFSNDRDAPGFRREERVKGNNQPRPFGVSGGGKGGKPVLRDPFAKEGHATTEDDEADLTFQWFRPVGLSSDSEPWREGSEGRRQRAAVPTTESSSSYTSILFTTDEEDAHGPYRRH